MTFGVLVVFVTTSCGRQLAPAIALVRLAAVVVWFRMPAAPEVAPKAPPPAPAKRHHLTVERLPDSVAPSN